MEKIEFKDKGSLNYKKSESESQKFKGISTSVALAIKLKCRNCGMVNDRNMDLGNTPPDMLHTFHPRWAKEIGMMCSGNYAMPLHLHNLFSMPHTCECLPDSAVIHDVISYKIIQE